MNIENELLPGEELLYQSKANPDKVDKHMVLFIAIFIFIIGILSITGLSCYKGNIISAFITGLIFFAFFPYFALMYRQVREISKAKGNVYFITNKRIFIYSEKSGFYSKSIMEIKSIQYWRDKENYGLLKLYTDLDFSEGIQNTLGNIIKRLMTMIKSVFREDEIIYLVGIENPIDVLDTFRKINPSISIYS